MSGDRNIQTDRYNRETQVRDQSTYIEGDYYNNNPEQKQNLAKAAAEIQQLLETLDKTYPTDTTTGKMKVAAAAVEQIDTNPALSNRVLSALKAGGVSAVEQLLNHPAASFFIAALQECQQTKTILSRETTYSQAKANLASLLDQVYDERQIMVIKRRNQKNVALIAEDELSSILETIYLLRSPENAKRLFRALEWAESEEATPQSLEELKEELGIES